MEISLWRRKGDRALAAPAGIRKRGTSRRETCPEVSSGGGMDDNGREIFRLVGIDGD